MPLPWFRRKQQSAVAPAAAAAPDVRVTPEVEPTPPAEPAPEAPSEGESADALRKKRRRGSRGGRNRKKPTDAAAEQADEPEAKPEKKQPERKAGAGERKQPRASSGSRSQTRRRQPPKRAPLPAAKRELVVSVDVGEQRVAVLEDDRVAEVYLERPERRSIAGNIYLGTVDNVLPGMEAAFVEIGLEKNGFLYVDEIVRPELEGKRHGKKIQDLISRGQTVLVQAVKDPMKTKGARLTMEISLPGRFVVFVPEGEGLGVSRRLSDDERTRLKEIIKGLDVKQGGVIVRTAAEGASAEDVERDLVFLQRLWKTIQQQAKTAKAPALIYQEAELPLRVTRDLFTDDFERALVDNDQAYKRIVGYLKKTSPHMVERVVRYKDKPPLFEALGIDAEIRSTLSRRVDLPSGGYLIFDYAEAFTVVDVNTGRFVGSRSKNSGARLEDTITKNNLEAVKEVVRQLRLRDIGGIIVIDFIDMANPSNRAQVEEALRTELERDRTKTYVVEISPLGLVEMTRQNVTDGPREILTKKCPTCGGDGIVYSEASAAVDVERRLKALAAGSRTQAMRVELNPKVASLLVGPGAARLVEFEAQTRKRFFVETREGVHLDHVAVLAEGSVAKLQPAAPVAQDAEVDVKLVEVDLYDANAAVGKLDGLDVVVADAAKLVGKKVKARIVRVLDGSAYAVQAARDGQAARGPLTAEAEAEKPTRKPPARKAPAAEEAVEAEAESTVEAEADAEFEESLDVGEIEEGEVAADGEAPPKKKTRRGSRGGRNRKRKPAGEDGAAPRIHLPDRELEEPAPQAEEQPSPGAEEQPAPPADASAAVAEAEEAPPVESEPAGAEPAAAEAEVAERSGNGDGVGADGERPRKRTRRGSRGGKNRRKRAERDAVGVDAANGSEAAAVATAELEPSEADGASGLELDVPEADGASRPTAELEAPEADGAAGLAAELEPPEADGASGPDEEPVPAEGEYVPMSEWLDDFEV